MINGKKVQATIQARMTSTRLPGKILMEAAGKPFLHHMVERLRKVSAIDDIIIATTTNKEDDPVVELAEMIGAQVFRGSELDVLSRVVGALRKFESEIVVQTTGDCPLIDPDVVNLVLETYAAGSYHFVANIIERSYPIGMDTQVFHRSVLEDVAQRTQDPVHREHVTSYIYTHPDLYKLHNVHAPKKFFDPFLRLTLDTSEDFELISRIFSTLYPRNPSFSLLDILTLLEERPDWRALNDDVPHKWLKTEQLSE